MFNGLDFQMKRDYQLIQGHYYTLLIDSITGHIQIVDSDGNYCNIARTV